MVKKAPNFKLKDQNDQVRTLKDYAGKYLLIYFYPRDLTPGCTTEACSFQENLGALKKLKLEVVGVSCDSVASHKKFADKYDLEFPLLSDSEQKMVNDYGVWVEKSMYGKKYMGIQRDSFLISPKGEIIKHYQKVKPAEHVAEIIKDLKEID
jgi:peroxiredoxin Q/BCP